VNPPSKKSEPTTKGEMSEAFVVRNFIDFVLSFIMERIKACSLLNIFSLEPKTTNPTQLIYPF